MKIINLTGHEIDVLFCEELKNGGCEICGDKSEQRTCGDSKVVKLQSKTMISAKPVQKVVKKDGQVEFATLEWKASTRSQREMEEIEKKYGKGDDTIYIGSVLAAQAFPERICAMIPVPGYERVPRSMKIVRSDRFTVFNKEGK